MQTFLPYPDFAKTAQCLDYKRLGKQRVEAKQILNILLSRTQSNAWRNHPCVKMWKGYEECLKTYYNAILTEWIARGYNNTMQFETLESNVVDIPKFIATQYKTNDFHESHKSNLLRKDKDFYSRYNWNVSDNLEYVWS